MGDRRGRGRGGGWGDGGSTEGPGGDGGLGYDPLFRLADGHTRAEIPPAEKNRISHRARAARAMLAALQRERP